MKRSSTPEPLRSLILAVTVALAPLAVCPAVAAERVIDRVAGVVNDDVIALSEVYLVGSQYIEQRCPDAQDLECLGEAEREVIEALVRRVLQRQELVRLGMDITQAEIDQGINMVVKDAQLPDRDALRSEVERAGFAWELYRQQQIEEPLRERRFQEAVLRNRVNVGEDELRDQYQRLVREVEAPPVASLSAFGLVLPRAQDAERLAETVQQVRAALAEARAGTRSWDDLVEQFDRAGLADLFAGRTFLKTDLNDKLAKAAFALEPGQITEPVIAGGVLYVMRLDSLGQGELDVPPFEEVKDKVAEQVFTQKLEQAADEWFEVAKRRAAIRYMVGSDDDEEDDEEEAADAP